MLTIAGRKTGGLATLAPQAPDVLLSLIAMHRDDPRPEKLDLGVGVYRNASGATPVFEAVKLAEALLCEQQDTKAYLGTEGDRDFLDVLALMIFGVDGLQGLGFGVQTPGGTGALRLGAELARAAGIERVWIGTPTWPNHTQIFDHVDVEIQTYPHYDPQTRTLNFDRMMDALAQASVGDLVLLHGCCHNPTGADLSSTQWETVAGAIATRGLTPFVDLAYQGLGQGLTADAAGLRMVIEASDDALVAYSCDKNFGIYRERTGALFVKSRRHSELARSNALALARCNWSMPPDHGAAVVRTILRSPELAESWVAELDTMRRQLMALRAALADADPRLAALRNQHGMFSLLPLNAGDVETLRREHAVYMVGSGRINIAGLSAQTVPRFAQIVGAYL